MPDSALPPMTSDQIENAVNYALMVRAGKKRASKQNTVDLLRIILASRQHVAVVLETLSDVKADHDKIMAMQRRIADGHRATAGIAAADMGTPMVPPEAKPADSPAQGPQGPSASGGSVDPRWIVVIVLAVVGIWLWQFFRP